ncbi:MAG: 4'-phosphopantetheinyl transferase superfamily protein [Bacteroidetes bacterium]|nr:4'-phosphopantetheinyl transferase superfamily protein [Bacteroidota bacterium]
MNGISDNLQSAVFPEIFLKGSWIDSFGELNSPFMVILKMQDVHPEDLVRFGRFLTEEETAKSGRFRFSHDRDSYIAVHGLLRWILGIYFGVLPEAVRIRYTSLGKPYVTGYSRQLFFNLSHSSGVSLLVFDPANEIGADVEKVDPEFEYESLVRRFFTKEEGNYIDQSGKKARERFFEIWTRKEAFLKAVGEGITENLSVEVLEEKISMNAIHPGESEGRNFLFRSALFEDEYRITLALSTESYPVIGFIPGANLNRYPITEA